MVPIKEVFRKDNPPFLIILLLLWGDILQLFGTISSQKWAWRNRPIAYKFWYDNILQK